MYKTEKRFVDCRNKLPLSFDFQIYIDEGLFYILLEYDGRQHFKEADGFWECLEKVQKKDKIKDEWCKENNIELIRIPYWEHDNIETILDKRLLKGKIYA